MLLKDSPNSNEAVRTPEILKSFIHLVVLSQQFERRMVIELSRVKYQSGQTRSKCLKLSESVLLDQERFRSRETGLMTRETCYYAQRIASRVNSVSHFINPY